MIQFFPDLQPYRYNGGEFFVDPRHPLAICLMRREGELLRQWVRDHQPAHVLEIGAHVGLSTAYLAVDAPGMVTAVDDFSANAGAAKAFHENMARAGLTSKVELFVGRSPACLAELAPDGGWDFVFIDGYHHNGQPIADVQGVYPHLAQSAIVTLHDTYIPEVYDARDFLVAQGFTEHDQHTSGGLRFYVRGNGRA